MGLSTEMTEHRGGIFWGWVRVRGNRSGVDLNITLKVHVKAQEMPSKEIKVSIYVLSPVLGPEDT